MRKEIFIVTSAEGAKVVSARVLAADVKTELKKLNAEYKRCDVESITNDVMTDYVGKSIDGPIYAELVEHIAETVVKYAQLTPYQFMKQLMAEA